MAIRERYLKLVETSDIIVKSYQELQSDNVDTTHIEALFATGKESMESGDFTLCEQNFESVLLEIEKAKVGGDVVTGAEESGPVPKEAVTKTETAVEVGAEEPTVEVEAQASTVEDEQEILSESTDEETAVEPDASSETDAAKEEPESTDEPESKEEGTSEDSPVAEPETEDKETEESEKPTPDDLDDMLDDLLEGL